MKIPNTSICGLVTILLAFAACTPSKEKEIEGKWLYAEWSVGGEAIDLKNMEEPQINFKEGGSYTVNAGFQEQSEKWRVDGDTLVMEYQDGNTQKLLINKLVNDTLELLGKAGELDTRLLLVKAKEQ